MALTDMNMGAEPTKKAHEDHPITLETIKNDFKEDFLDEIEDCNKYCDMAMAAEEMGHTELARGLYGIAHDEYTHAHFIHDNLVDWGYEIPEKEMLKWHELKERIHRKFR